MYKQKISSLKFALLPLMLCFSALLISAQEQTNSSAGELQPKKNQPCSLTLSDAPTIRGISFGMTTEEAENTLGIKMMRGLILPEDRQKGFETLTFFRNRVNKYPSQLDGIESIELRFFGNQLYSFSLSFDNSTKWENIAGFTASLSNEFKLPQSWQTDGSSQARMKCQDFTVTANTYFLPEVSLTDTTKTTFR